MLLDNAAIHNALVAKSLIEAAQARILYLPPYTPELQPIELAWNVLKAAIRRSPSQFRRDPVAFIVGWSKGVSRETATNWFAHCGWVA